MDPTEIYMASPDWIKALMIVTPCLTVFGCVYMICTRWPRRKAALPASAPSDAANAESLLYADPAARQQAGQWLLQGLEQALLERRRVENREPETLPAAVES